MSLALFRPLRAGCAALLLLWPLGALAQDYVSDGGVRYAAVPGTPGAVLRSEGEQTYHVGFAGQPVTGVETIRLAPDCSAKSALVGRGHWFRNGAGFSAVFVEGASVTFVDQPPPEAAGPGCESSSGTAAPASAPAAWVSGNGTGYDVATEAGGVVLTSRTPQTYYPGHMGTDGPPATGPETIRLRADCTAESTLLGDGMWMRLEGSTVVSWLAGDTITFGAVPDAGVGPGC